MSERIEINYSIIGIFTSLLFEWVTIWKGFNAFNCLLFSSRQSIIKCILNALRFDYIDWFSNGNSKCAICLAFKWSNTHLSNMALYFCNDCFSIASTLCTFGKLEKMYEQIESIVNSCLLPSFLSVFNTTQSNIGLSTSTSVLVFV